MIIRKITFCTLLFVILLTGAGLLNKYINQIHYPDSQLSPLSYTDNINNQQNQEPNKSSNSFYPREYIRIIRLKK